MSPEAVRIAAYWDAWLDWAEWALTSGEYGWTECVLKPSPSAEGGRP